MYLYTNVYCIVILILPRLAPCPHIIIRAINPNNAELNETAKELKERGVIKDTATAVEETVGTAREIRESVIHTAQQLGESAPLTDETIRNAAIKKTRTNKSS